MHFITLATMIVVLGLVWGGMVFFLTRAIKYEKIKKKNAKNQS